MSDSRNRATGVIVFDQQTHTAVVLSRKNGSIIRVYTFQLQQDAVMFARGLTDGTAFKKNPEAWEWIDIGSFDRVTVQSCNYSGRT